MKSLIISTLCLAFFIGCWMTFYDDSANRTQTYVKEIKEVMIPAVHAHKWEVVEKEFDTFGKDWHKYKKAASFFLDTKTLNETDFSIAKAEEYIKERDASNASGELASLREQFKFLYENERFSMSNIF